MRDKDRSCNRERRQDVRVERGLRDRRKGNQCNGWVTNRQRNRKSEIEYGSLSSINSLIICL